MKTLNLCLGIAWLLGGYSAVAAVADRFDYPIGNRDRYTQANDGDGWYSAQEFGDWSDSFSNYHLGEDWNAETGGNTDCGLPVYAVANGTIVYASIASGWGRVLIVRHTLPDGSQVESLYGHLASFSKTSGDVTRDEQVGTIGDGSEGGSAYFCHLHFEIRTPGCPKWGQPGAGGSATPKPVGWTDPSGFIDLYRQAFGLNDGLVAYYPFNGNANDASGNGYDGIVNGAISDGDRFGNPGASYSFTGSNNWVRANVGPEFFKPAFTFSVWVKFADFASDYPHIVAGDRYDIVCHGLGAAYPPNLRQKIGFYQQAQPYPEGGIYRQGQMITTNVCETNVWYHVCIVRSDTSFRMYVNGILSTEITDPNRISLSGSYLEFGRNPVDSGENSSFHGNLDDIRIYNRALSPSEILHLFSASGIWQVPWLIQQPTNRVASGGSVASFSASAGGVGPIHFQCRVKGQKNFAATNGTLTLTNSQASDSGGYSVVVWNAYGSVVSTTAFLKILADPANGTQVARVAALYCPAPPVNVDSLVLITHGVEPLYQLNPWGDISWITNMANAVRARVSANWEVRTLDWTTVSQVTIPDTASILGAIGGHIYGSQLGRQRNWQHVHLIAHSAGASVIEAIASELKALPTPPVIHETFLDPYLGSLHQRQSDFGSHSDWAENYFAANGFSLWTNAKLPHAHNVDVSWLDSANISYVTNYCSPSGMAETTPATVYEQQVACGVQAYVASSHGWPHDFYQASIANGPPGAAGYGFPLSEEVNGWNNLASYPANNDPVVLNGQAAKYQYLAPPQIGLQVPFNLLPNATSSSGVNFSGDSSATLFSIVSQASFSPNGTGILPMGGGSTTNVPAWLSVGLTVTNPVNFVQFDAGFDDTNSAQGLLTVYWDTNQIGMVDERVATKNLQTYRFALPGTATNDVYVLGFRLDSFSNTLASVTVTNVATGFVGVNQPITLSVALFTNNTPVLQLTGPSNYNYVVQSSTNFFDWTPTALLVNSNGTVFFADPTAPSSGKRFYRALLP